MSETEVFFEIFFSSSLVLAASVNFLCWFLGLFTCFGGFSDFEVRFFVKHVFYSFEGKKYWNCTSDFLIYIWFEKKNSRPEVRRIFQETWQWNFKFCCFACVLSSRAKKMYVNEDLNILVFLVPKMPKKWTQAQRGVNAHADTTWLDPTHQLFAYC